MYMCLESHVRQEELSRGRTPDAFNEAFNAPLVHGIKEHNSLMASGPDTASCGV